MARKLLVAGEVQRVIHEYTVEKMSLSQIGRKHYLSTTTIFNYLKANNISCSVVLQYIDKEIFIQDWNNGMSSRDMKEKHNISTTAKLHFFVNKYRKEGNILRRRLHNGKLM